MLGRLGRIGAFALLGWFVFLVGSLAYAAARRREPVPAEPEADEVDLVATFSPLDFRSTARAFRGGRVETRFGGGVIDLREATLDPMGATLEVSSLFGGGNLVVPADWNVETHVLPVFGGVGDGRPQQERSPDAPTLRVEGIAVFGGWGITAQPSDSADIDEQVLAPV